MTDSNTMRSRHIPIDLRDEKLFKLQCLIKTTGLLCSATCEFNSSRFLALMGENSEIIFYFEKKLSAPIVKRILWYQGCHKQISALCFDISGAYLLSVSVDGSLYIIPALAFVDKCYTDDGRWNTMDITYYPFVVSQSTYSRPTAIIWWQDGSQLDIAIVGTECGEIIFVNLETKERICMACVDEHISMFQICEDKSNNNKYLLITSQLKQQWRLILEEQEHSCLYNLDGSKSCNVEESNITICNNAKPFAFTRSKLQELKQLSVEKFTVLKQKFIETKALSSSQNLDSTNNDNRNSCAVDPELKSDSGIRLVTAELLPTDIFLEPQSISTSQQLYTSYDCVNSSVTFYGLNFSPLPLAEYKVPILLGNIIFTQKLLIVTNINKQGICIISSQLSEIPSNKQSNINAECIIAKFSFKDSEEVIQSIYKATDFEPKKQKLSDNVNDIYVLPEKLKGVTVDVPHVDTVIVVTNHSVYKIVLRIPLLYVFMDMVLMRNEIERAKILALVFGINLPQLLECAGDILLANKELSQAINVYRLAKCRLVKTVLKFATFGYTTELLSCLMHCLSSPSITELSTATRIHFSNLCILVLVNVTLRTTTSALKQIHKDFIYFLSVNNFYDELLAARVAGQVHLWEILHYLATKRGLHEQILNILLKNGSHFGITLDNFHFLSHGFLICVSEPTLIHAMLVNSDLGRAHMEFTTQHLSEFQVFVLQRLMALYDPTNPIIRPRLQHCRAHHRNILCGSQSSQSELIGSAGNTAKIDTLIESFIDTFLLVLLTLIHKKSHSNQYLSFEDGIQHLEPKEELKLKVDFKRRQISSGYSHASLIRNGYVFTWGCSTRGSLGTGPSVFKYDSPRPLTFFDKMKLEVLSVSCGHYHTLTVTNNGIYAWGSSQYGQLGIAGVLQCPTPELITTLAQEVIVDAVAGQYHSVALTADGRVFTWGWGVHGQLGHGNTDERHTPTLVSSLLGIFIHCISAGHAHTLVLSTDGIVYAFGCNVFGQLGTGDTKKCSLPIQVLLIPEKISLIATGYFHNLAVTCTNKLYTWGASPQVLRIQAHAQKKTRTLDKRVDVSVHNHEDVETPERHISNSKHGDNVTENLSKINREGTDDVELTKKNAEIKVARSNTTHVNSNLEESQMHLKPSLVDISLLNGKIVQISAGCHHNALVTKDGSLYTWGRNLDGQLGNGTRREVVIPTPLTYNPSFIFAQVPPRHNNRTNIEKSVSSPENLENSVDVEKNKPGEVQPLFKEATNVEEHINPTIKTVGVCCGYDYTLAIQPGGAVLAWGNNNRAQLGRIPIHDVQDGDVKLVLLKSSKRVVRIPQTSQMSLDTPSHVPNIPAPIISYKNYDIASLAACLRPLSLIEKSPGHLTLHHVLDRFFGLYDDAKILEKCIQLGNYPACAKIAALQQNTADAFAFELKTLYALNTGSLSEVQIQMHINKSTESLNSVEESSSVRQQKANTKLFNEQIDENLIQTMKDNAIKNHMKISTSKSLNNLETLAHGLHNFDCQGAPEQLCTDSKCGNNVLALVAGADCKSTMKRENSEEWFENILSADVMLDQNNDQSPVNNINVLKSNEMVLNPHTRSTPATHAECFVDSELAFASRSQKNNVINEAIKLIKYYLRDIENDSVEIKCKILKSAIDFWISHDLPIQSLENAFVEHINLIFYPLGLLIFCQDATQRYLFNHGREIGHKANIINIFSLNFCLRICCMLLQYAHRDNLLPEYVTLFSSITAIHYGPPLIGFPGSSENKSFEQMIHGVISTISNANYEPKPFIHIKEPSSVYSFLLSENDVVVFTCGHNFPFSSFMLEIIPGMETELLTTSSLLPCTAQFLEKLFGGPYEPELLCPVCIPHALAMLIQNDAN